MFTRRPGFTLIEFLVVVAIMGILSLSLVPSVLNTLETRALENTAREIIASLEKAKFAAVTSKFNHRIRFLNDTGDWRVVVEREQPPGTWVELTGYPPKIIAAKFNITINLPPADLAVEFSQMGFVTNHDKDYNSILIQSDKLKRQYQDDQREVIILASGSFRFLKSASGT
jgi:prepilin-type N-terminal cleavage/methylation domain-containing protein